MSFGIAVDRFRRREQPREASPGGRCECYDSREGNRADVTWLRSQVRVVQPATSTKFVFSVVSKFHNEFGPMREYQMDKETPRGSYRANWSISQLGTPSNQRLPEAYRVSPDLSFVHNRLRHIPVLRTMQCVACGTARCTSSRRASSRG